jgi:hypothetical protein
VKNLISLSVFLIVLLSGNQIARGQCPIQLAVFDQSTTSSSTPNSSISVGRTKILAVEDDRIRVYDKCGNQLLAEKPIDGINGFWPTAPAGAMRDVRCFYDDSTTPKRFWISGRDNASLDKTVHYAFTSIDDPNPNGLWFKKSFDLLTFGNVFAASDLEFSLSRDFIWLAATIDNSPGRAILAVDKISLLQNPTDPPILFLQDLNINVPADSQFDRFCSAN